MSSLGGFKERFLYSITDRLPKNVERAKRLDEAIERVRHGDSVDEATSGMSKDEVEAVRAAVWVSNLPRAEAPPFAVMKGKAALLEKIAQKVKGG